MIFPRTMNQVEVIEMRLQSSLILALVLAGVTCAAVPAARAETAEGYYHSGLAFGEQGKFPEAIAAFTKAIEKNLTFAKAYNNRGVVYYKLGDLIHASFDFVEAIEIAPNYLDAYCNLGLLYARQGNFPRAIFAFTKAIEINPKYARAYANRAAAYFKEKEYGQAWADVHKAEALGSGLNTEFLENLKQDSGRNK
jgi:tetratricopeptide (TPR) repeat protein